MSVSGNECVNVKVRESDDDSDYGNENENEKKENATRNETRSGNECANARA